MSDAADVANDIMIDYNDDALARARRLCEPQSHPDFDGSNCVACCEPIPVLRLAMQKVRCTECQAALERGGRR